MHLHTQGTYFDTDFGRPPFYDWRQQRTAAVKAITNVVFRVLVRKIKGRSTVVSKHPGRFNLAAHSH